MLRTVLNCRGIFRNVAAMGFLIAGDSVPASTRWMFCGKSRKRIFVLGGTMKSRILFVVIMFPLVGLAQQGNRKFITSELARSRNLPFSSGVLAGNTLYIAGTTADPDKIKAGLTPEAEVRDIMEQIKGTVEKAGMTMNDIVSMQVFTTDLDLYDAFNGVYRSYFKANYPARAFIGGSKLLFGSRFEVLGIAVKNGA